MTSSLALPSPENVTRVVLDNGMIVLVRENHSAPVAVLEGNLPAGAIYDPPGKTGLAAMTASLLSRGSARYDFDAFNEAVESVGASLAVSADAHAIDFGSHSLSEDFPAMVEILADILRRPTFPEDHVARVRRQRLVHLQERDQDTHQVASLRFYESIYRNHPYGRPTSGYVETVREITRDDIVDFYTRRFTPNGAIIVVCGDVDTPAVIDLLRRHLEDWRRPQPEPMIAPAPSQTAVQRDLYPLPGKVQADIVVGCHAVPRNHPDYNAVRVANTILGRFGMMGRLGERVREEQGLAYYAYSTQDASLHAGVWLALAGVNPAHVTLAVESILAEFARLGEEPVPDAELADSQAYMTGVLPLTLETNEGVASTLLNMEWYGLGLDYLQRYNELIYNVTPAEVQRVARAYLRTDAYTLSVAGPL
jgi:zinc protease